MTEGREKARRGNVRDKRGNRHKVIVSPIRFVSRDAKYDGLHQPDRDSLFPGLVGDLFYFTVEATPCGKASFKNRRRSIGAGYVPSKILHEGSPIEAEAYVVLRLSSHSITFHDPNFVGNERIPKSKVLCGYVGSEDAVRDYCKRLVEGVREKEVSKLNSLESLADGEGVR